MFSFSKLNLQDKYILLKEEEISIHNTNFHEMLKLQTSDVNNSSVHLCFFFFFCSVWCNNDCLNSTNILLQNLYSRLHLTLAPLHAFDTSTQVNHPSFLTVIVSIDTTQHLTPTGLCKPVSLPGRHKSTHIPRHYCTLRHTFFSVTLLV